MKNVLLVIGLIMLSWGVFGCGEAEPPVLPSSNEPVPAEQSVAVSGVIDHLVTESEIGREAVCPVMGTKFKVTKSNQAAEYKGQTYYFCCGGCPDAFKKDPEKYIKAQSEQDKHKGHNH